MQITKQYRMLRDTQRSKVYAAENKALKAFAVPLATVPEMEKFVERVRKRATLVRRYGPELARSIRVGDGRMRRRAAGNAAGIYMPRWSRLNWIVLHELAHTLSIRKHGRQNIAGHGREFCAVYIDLVRYMIGKEAADALKASFVEHGVKYKKRRIVK